MAKFVDLLINLNNKVRRHFKKALETLGDDYIIRSPVLAENGVAAIIIQGPNQAWLCLGHHIDAPEKSDLDLYHQFIMELAEHDFKAITYVAVIDQYDGTDDLFSVADDSAIRVDKADFLASPETFINAHMVVVTDEQHLWMKQQLFPEATIHRACTTRAVTVKDTSARLTPMFLDFDQEWAAKLDIFEHQRDFVATQDYTVRLLNGVAGSGKTLILINRALLYCQQYPDRQVLLLIHNKPVTRDVRLKIERYLGGVPSNLVIKTFHAYALKQWRQVPGYQQQQPIFNFDKLPLATQALFSVNSDLILKNKLTQQQLWAECEYINELLIADKDHYLAVERQGRGFALQSRQRKDIWSLYEKVMRSLKDCDGLCLPSLYIRKMALYQKFDVFVDQYDHILLDEVQFFAPAWLTLIKKSLVTNGQLFMCADPNQGFLKNRLSWKSVGLNVRGRTKKLRTSYRTTFSILKAANALLELMADDPEDFLRPDFDKMTQGSLPRVINSQSGQDESVRFLNELEACIKLKTVPMNQIMVLYSAAWKPWVLKDKIEQRCGLGIVFNFNDAREKTDHNDNQIKLVSMNSCTGMEAGITFVLGVGYLLLQYKNIELSEEEVQVKKQEIYRTLYVVMTRAGQQLVMFSTEPMPEEILPFVAVEGESG